MFNSLTRYSAIGYIFKRPDGTTLPSTSNFVAGMIVDMVILKVTIIVDMVILKVTIIVDMVILKVTIIVDMVIL